jgi:APA family basic amino acid/polyamine antiporter
MVVGNTIGSGIFLKPGKIAADAGSFPMIVGGWIVGGLVCLAGALCFAELAAMLPRAGGIYVYLKEAYGRPIAFLFGWSEFFFGTPASCGALSVAIVSTLSLLINPPPLVTSALTTDISETQTTLVLESVADWPAAEVFAIDVDSEKMIVIGIDSATKTVTVERGDGGTAAAPHAAGAKVIGRPPNLNRLLIVVGALLLLALVAFINVCGAIWGGRLQAVTTIIKAGCVAFIALAPFFLFFIGRSQVDFGHYATSSIPENVSFSARFAAVMLAVMWAYNGWEGVTPVAAEVRDPNRNIPRALLGGVGILIAVYVGANIAYHGVLSMNELIATSTSRDTAQVMLAKQFNVFGGQIGQAAALMASLVISLSAFGAINSNLLQSPRVAYAMGQDGVFFRQLGFVHARFRTPAIAICTQATMAAVMVVAFEVAKRTIPQLKRVDLFDILTDYVIFSASVFLLLAVIGVILLRFKHPEWERPYRVTGYPLTPLLYVAFYIWFLPTAYFQQSFSAHVAIALIALGIPAYFLYAVAHRKSPAG